MEEIKVGEYIRTKRGIAKITDLVCGQDAYFDTENIFELNDIDFYRNNGIDIHGSFFRDLVIDHSQNMLDLIKEGDFVNGYICKRIPNFDNKMCNFDLNLMQWIPLEEIDVWYDIVTHEQFNQMKYIVGGE